MIVDLLQILARKNRSNADNKHSESLQYLSNILSIESSIFKNSFDIDLGIPLFEKVLNSVPNEEIHRAVSRLAALACPIVATPTPSQSSVTQLSSSYKVILESSIELDTSEGRAPKRMKLGSGEAVDQNKYVGFGRKYDLANSNQHDLFQEPILHQRPAFQYRPLDSARREIRLLVLHPVAGVWSSFSYSCSLIHVSLEENPDYEALSYVWGSEAKKQIILVDGQRLFITANLADALDHLHDSRGSRKLWVDAICINQNDIPERNDQVRSMTEIYTRARNVVVWIGVLEKTNQNWLDRMENPKADDQSPEHLRKWTVSAARIMVSGSMAEDAETRLWRELAGNPWFKRVWVIQEVAVAREVVVQTARTTITWSTFSAALEKASSNYEMKSVVETVKTINSIRTARSRKPYYMDLLDLLDGFRHCLATDERDKIFALVGLCSSSLAQERVIHVSPDYSKPSLDIFRSLTKQYINGRKNLDIICHATLSNHMPTPSWVPIWSWYDAGLRVLPKRRVLGTRHGPMYRCCGEMELDRELLLGADLSDDRLWLSGFQFDIVSVVSRVAADFEDLGLEGPINGGTNLISVWKSMSEMCSFTYGSDLEEAFQRTLHADVIGGRRYQESTQSTNMGKETNGGGPLDDSVSESSTGYVYLTEGKLGTVEREKEVERESISSDSTSDSAASIKRAAIKRSFFVTEKGYMGLGPSSIEEGDLVYVLSGGQAPFILRPKVLREGFSLVGESYVHGIMDGEATVLGKEVETFYLV